MTTQKEFFAPSVMVEREGYAILEINGSYHLVKAHYDYYEPITIESHLSKAINTLIDLILLKHNDGGTPTESDIDQEWRQATER
jgi:hypothetical protein